MYDSLSKKHIIEDTFIWRINMNVVLKVVGIRGDELCHKGIYYLI